MNNHFRQIVTDLADLTAEGSVQDLIISANAHLQGYRHFIVCGRREHELNVTGHVKLHPMDDRSAWEVFVEEVLYSTCCESEAEQVQMVEDNGGSLPADVLPYDWRSRDPSEEDDRRSVWAYHNSTVEIFGPPLSMEAEPFE